MMCCDWYGIAQVLRHVHVQVVGVRIDQAGRQAGERAAGNRPARCAAPAARASASAVKTPLQQFAAAVGRNHQDAHEESAVQVGPQNRGRRQERQVRHPGQRVLPFPDAFERAVEQHQENSVNRCGRASQ